MTGNVEFDEDSSGYGRPRPMSTPGVSPAATSGAYARYGEQVQLHAGSNMERWLIRHHLAKSPKSAQLVLLGIVAVNIILTIVIILKVL